MDLYRFNISTHLINPTFYKTNLNKTDIQKQEILKRFHAAPSDVQNDYGKDFIESRKNHSKL